MCQFIMNIKKKLEIWLAWSMTGYKTDIKYYENALEYSIKLIIFNISKSDRFGT